MGKICILSAAYNAAEFLQEMLDSLAAQTCRDFRLVIVDDCSDDGTAAILAAENRFEIEVIRNRENLGLTKSLNVGLKRCDSEWVMRMDADDVCEPNRLESQLDFIRRNPDLVLFSAQMITVDHNGRETGIYRLPLSEAEIRFHFLFCNPFGHPTACFRSEALKRAGGGYNESFRTCQDYELWSRLLTQGSVANQEPKLVRYRRHDSTVGVARVEEQLRAINRVRTNHFRAECERLGAATEKETEQVGAVLVGQAPGEISPVFSLSLSHRVLSALAKSYGLSCRSRCFQFWWTTLCRREQRLSRMQRAWWILQRGRCGASNLLYELRSKLA